MRSSTPFSPTTGPIVFAFHGYPWLIHRLTYRRTNHDNMHVRGYKEEGTTTTPFDMTVLNDLDRFHLAGDVIDRVPGLAERRRRSETPSARQADRAQAVHRALRGRYAGDSRLEVVVAGQLAGARGSVAQHRTARVSERPLFRRCVRVGRWRPLAASGSAPGTPSSAAPHRESDRTCV